MTKAFSGKVALVTGASRGIGRAAAIALGREGAHVICVARTVGGLEETDDAIQKAGGTATLYVPELRGAELESEMLAVLCKVALQAIRVALRMLRDDDDGVRLAALVGGAHLVGDCFWRSRDLRDGDRLGAPGDSRHQCEVAAVTPHHFDHERAMMRRGRRLQSVDGLERDVEGRVDTERVDQFLAEQAHRRGAQDDDALLVESDHAESRLKVQDFRETKLLQLDRFELFVHPRVPAFIAP